MKYFGGNFNGTDREIVKAKTKKAAAEALGISLYYFNEYACETGNENAIAELDKHPPGTVLIRKDDCFSKDNKYEIKQQVKDGE